MDSLPFSILIPTWNNLPLLKICVESIRKHSATEHQMIVHLNEGNDGSLEWIKSEGIDFTHSSENVGVCIALNNAAKLSRTDYICFFNDDMYALPGWDVALSREIRLMGEKKFFLSATMIEPVDTGNKAVIVKDFGKSADDFDEDKLLGSFRELKKEHWSGATWPPNVVHKSLWEKVGGYSEEFSPGLSSDPDFSMKLWQAGVRDFKGVGDSRVYHFLAKSTTRVKKNPGAKQFLDKWGITQSTFAKYFLHRGEPYQGTLTDPGRNPAFHAARLKANLKKWLG